MLASPRKQKHRQAEQKPRELAQGLCEYLREPAFDDIRGQRHEQEQRGRQYLDTEEDTVFNTFRTFRRVSQADVNAEYHRRQADYISDTE